LNKERHVSIWKLKKEVSTQDDKEEIEHEHTEKRMEG
jgi:hypothetical protein